MPKTIKSQAANALSHVISELPPQMVRFYFILYPPQSTLTMRGGRRAKLFKTAVQSTADLIASPQAIFPRQIY
jgi:hypothetical protein